MSPWLNNFLKGNLDPSIWYEVLFSIPRARNTFQLVLQACMSIACANTSDAITESYNRTKDLFTLHCSFVAMVLDYDVTIQVLGFLIESWCGMDGGWVSSCICVWVNSYESQTSGGVTYFIWAGSGLDVDLLKREIRFICVPKTKTETHAHTYRESASQRIPLIFLLLCWSFNHNKEPLLCWPLCVVLEKGWHARTQTLNAFLLAACYRLKYREIWSLSCMNWIKLFVSHYQDIWSCLITNTNRNIRPRKNRATSFCCSLSPTGFSECIPIQPLESFIRQWNHMIAYCPN